MAWLMPAMSAFACAAMSADRAWSNASMNAFGAGLGGPGAGRFERHLDDAGPVRAGGGPGRRGDRQRAARAQEAAGRQDLAAQRPIGDARRLLGHTLRLHQQNLAVEVLGGVLRLLRRGQRHRDARLGTVGPAAQGRIAEGCGHSRDHDDGNHHAVAADGAEHGWLESRQLSTGSFHRSP